MPRLAIRSASGPLLTALLVAGCVPAPRPLSVTTPPVDATAMVAQVVRPTVSASGGTLDSYQLAVRNLSSKPMVEIDVLVRATWSNGYSDLRRHLQKAPASAPVAPGAEVTFAADDGRTVAGATLTDVAFSVQFAAFADGTAAGTRITGSGSGGGGGQSGCDGITGCQVITFPGGCTVSATEHDCSKPARDFPMKETCREGEVPPMSGTGRTIKDCMCYCDDKSGRFGYTAEYTKDIPGQPSGYGLEDVCPGCNTCPAPRRSAASSTAQSAAGPAIHSESLSAFPESLPMASDAQSCSVCPPGSRIQLIGNQVACVCGDAGQSNCLRGTCYTDSPAAVGKAAVMDVCQNGHFPGGFDSTTNYVGACAGACGARGGMCLSAGGCSSIPGIGMVNPGGITDGSFKHDPGADVLCICNGQ